MWDNAPCPKALREKALDRCFFHPNCRFLHSCSTIDHLEFNAAQFSDPAIVVETTMSPDNPHPKDLILLLFCLMTSIRLQKLSNLQENLNILTINLLSICLLVIVISRWKVHLGTLILSDQVRMTIPLLYSFRWSIFNCFSWNKE